MAEDLANSVQGVADVQNRLLVKQNQRGSTQTDQAGTNTWTNGLSSSGGFASTGSSAENNELFTY